MTSSELAAMETWTEQAPGRWERRRLKTLCSMRSGSAIASEDIKPEGAYPVYGGNGRRGWTQSFTHEGRFPLIGRQGARCGNVHLVDGKFWATEHAVVVTPAAAVDPGWLAQLLAMMDLGQYSQAAAQPGLAVERIRVLQAVKPPLEEQRLIARYLDHADLLIGRACNEKRSLIGLLDERRRAVSQMLVTRGLDDTSNLRPSELPWLGDVPAHWETRPAKFFYREVNDRSERGQEQLMSVSHLTGVTPRASKNVTMFMAASYVGHKLCRPDDLVINTMWAWMGALGVARETGIVSPAYAVYRPLPGSPLSPDYADLLLRTRPYIDEYTCRSTGIRASRLRLYPDRFMTIPTVCPPADEQQQIVKRVTAATAELDTSISAALREVELLQEYRTSLVETVVTGRRDVRDEASGLPDLAPGELEAVLSVGFADDDGEDEA
jgi:type I restriction enzyme S subunit